MLAQRISHLALIPYIHYLKLAIKAQQPKLNLKIKSYRIGILKNVYRIPGLSY